MMHPFRAVSLRSSSSAVAFSAVALAALALSGCVQEDSLPRNSRHYVPLPPQTLSLMAEKNMTKEAPILIRAYKQESELEIWKKTSEGKYAYLKTFPMCRWSGQLGPKTREGDRQVPEGFYAISPGQLNPNSNYYLSFNVGYPNQLDKAYGRDGGLIMVHGACSSAGCLSMTDEQIAEIYALTREAFSGGQQQVQMQSMPFRMTATNLAKFRSDPNIAFWKNLKEGADHFEVTKQEPKVAACGKKYVFNADAKGAPLEASKPCPVLSTETTLASAVREKAHADEVKVAELVTQGVKAVRRTYVDGDQHPSFKSTLTADGSVATRSGRFVEVSQNHALAGATEVAIEDSVAKAPKVSTAVASLSRKAAPVVASEPASSPVLALASEPSQKLAALSVRQDLSAATASIPSPVYAPAAPAPKSSSLPFYSSWLGAGEAKAEAPVALVAEPPAITAALPATGKLTPAKSDAAKAEAGKLGAAKIGSASTGPVNAGSAKPLDGKTSDGKTNDGKPGKKQASAPSTLTPTSAGISGKPSSADKTPGTAKATVTGKVSAKPATQTVAVKSAL